ncbi:nucleotidyltransferase [Sporosarcina gallistercoris]|uniref:tRNA(Met) cytidine acetate ligase n=1 Tax=Sporosarcina gallistercoris TaxID=2762245 RepID=A0ABR8PGE6_9BACL|nr:nucleotidyltransferase [Sporosarcina gallistercoris]MBD7907229.1 nucleotidyltransferase [Sporosarcina gallistercoris]
MKAVGIVVEYNPFHNGHLYHATSAKDQTDSDLVIAVMSGNFLQRGEPALIDKWTRTEMALENGVDLVFELPYERATSNAPSFAAGAIQLLDAAGCSSFCFGSENGTIAPFTETLSRITSVRSEYDNLIRESVQQGMSYPKALNRAYSTLIRTTKAEHETVDLSLPNNILGFHYMEAAKEIGTSMEPATLPRLGAGYHDDVVHDTPIASATGIRKEFFERRSTEHIQQFVPDSVYRSLNEWLTKRKSFGSWEGFYPILRLQILRDGPERLSTIADVTEGIENLLYKAAKQSDTFQQFMGVVKSKRYTWTRIQRMLTHIYTGFTYRNRASMQAPDHLRLLGMTSIGQAYLKERKEELKLPVVSRLANFDSPSANFSSSVSDLYAFGIDPIHPALGLDYRIPPIRKG